MKLSITNLSKTYANGVKALDGLSLEISTGLFGLLGPNGAGKSSLMRTLAGLQSADQGEITLADLDVLKHKSELRKILGYLPQEFGVFPKISAIKLLDYYALLKGLSNNKERKETVAGLLDQVNLYNDRHRAVYNFSGGMKQRFGIAQALLGSPKLIIVDEPTAGLDPSERVKFNNLLSETSEDRIVLLSTHIVDDVSELCSNMAIINKGKVVMTGSPSTLIDQLKGSIWEKRIEKQAYAAYDKEFNIVYSRLSEGKPLIHILSETDPGEGFINVQPKLDDVYFTSINDSTSVIKNAIKAA